MDLAKILKDAGADKPKQTRPNDAKWHNNMIQFRCSSLDPWRFWDLDELEYNMLDFVAGKQKLEALREEHGTSTVEFRLVAIMEVS